MLSRLQCLMSIAEKHKNVKMTQYWQVRPKRKENRMAGNVSVCTTYVNVQHASMDGHATVTARVSLREER